MAKPTLPQRKFKGAEDPEGIRSYLKYFKLYVDLNGWNDESAGKFLTISLEGDAQAFLFELPVDGNFRKSFKALSDKLVERYEGGLAVLKYIRDWQQRTRKKGEPLNTYLTDLRVMYDRAFPMQIVADIEDDAKNKIRLAGAACAHEVNKEFAIKAQFINGLEPGVRDILVCDEDIMSKTMDQVLRRVASLEAERSTVQRPVVAAIAGNSGNPGDGTSQAEIQKIIQEEVEKSVDRFALVQGTWIPRGRGRGRGRFQRFRGRGGGPKPSDVCHKCGGKGHWQGRCPSLNE